MTIDPRTPNHAADTDSERLRHENEELRRQLAELTSSGQHPAPPMWKPSGITLSAILFMLVVLTAIAFLGGYIPLQKQQAQITSEAAEQERALPRVEAIVVGRSVGRS